MNIIYGCNKQVHDFVARLVPECGRGFGKCSTLGVVHKGKLIAGLVYHNWNPESSVIEISGAATNPRWLTKPVLHAMFAYPFDQLNVQLLVMRVSENDKRLRRMLRAYNFIRYRIPRLRGRDEAEIIYTLSDDDWRENRFERLKKA